jgi:hypothetical protein
MAQGHICILSDLRTCEAKRHRDLTAQFLHEIAPAGKASVWQTHLVSSLCDVTVAIELLRCKLAQGELVSPKALDKLVARQRVLMRDLYYSSTRDD